MRDGDEFVFTGALDFTPGEDEPPEADADTSNITVAVSFPGSVLEHNGEASGNTVRWQTSFEGRIEMTARASATPSGPPAWVWAVAAAAVLLLAALVVLVVRRRRSVRP